MSDKYAVIGNPIAHSRSPEIHTQFAIQTNQDLNYTKSLVAHDHILQFIDDFFNAGGSGLNVTIPFKEQAFAAAQKYSTRAARAKAANTLYQNRSGELLADNTDGPGIIRDIEENLGVSLAGASVLILGAGGAVRGILAGICDLNADRKPSSVTIANRTLKKAEQLESEFHAELTIQSASFESLQGTYDIIINGTSMGLLNETPNIDDALVSAQTLCYDMVYSNDDTAFMAWAKQAGSTRVSDGLGMLVEQAAEAFEIWRGIRPETGPVIHSLRGK